MKNTIVTILFLLVTLTLKAQQQPAAIPGKYGIFVLCGNTFAKGFEYQVYIKQPKGWTMLTKMKFPGSLSEFNARINEAMPLYPYLKAPGEKEIKRIWEHALMSKVIDSIAPFSVNPLILEALGAGNMVTSVERARDYNFKVVKSYGASKADTLKPVLRAKYPGARLTTWCKAYSVGPQEKSVTVEFEITNPGRMFDCDVYRSAYLRNDFRLVSVTKLYSSKEGKTYLSVFDDGVVKGAGYSYFVVPFDPLGNIGSASDTINIYNVLPGQLSVTLDKFSATSLEKENAIKLSWKLSQIKDIVSIDIYRSENYDNGYRKITSIKPTDTVYLDRSVNPVTAYFYTLRLNGEYQRSFHSTRIHAILKPNRLNTLPPQDLIIKRTGNKLVTLCWRRMENDTRGYYVYRATGYKGEPRQISSLILSNETNVCYTDTLTGADEVQTYTYSVADVNTSYAISPLSEPASLQIVPSDLPVPTKVGTSLLGSKVMVLWDDMVKSYPYVIGYKINRRVEDFRGKNIEAPKNIAFLTSDKNFIEDSLVQENRKYYYTIQCVGIDSTSKGSPSQEVGCFIYASVVPSPSNLKVFPQEKSVIIQWDEPMANDITAYKLYRAEKNGMPVEIATISRGTSEYTDNKIEKGKSYYYAIETVINDGIKSKRTDLVGITVPK